MSGPQIRAKDATGQLMIVALGGPSPGPTGGTGEGEFQDSTAQSMLGLITSGGAVGLISVATTTALAAYPTSPSLQGRLASVSASGGSYWSWYPTGSTPPAGAQTTAGNGGVWALESSASMVGVTGPSAVNVVLAYGADPTGATDSAPAINAARTALAASGQTLSYPPSVYKYATKQVQPSHTRESFAPGVTVNQVLTAGAGNALSNDTWYNVGQQAAFAAGTLAATPAIGATSLSVNFGSSPAAYVGQWMEIVHAVAGLVVFQIVSVAGAGPYTIGIDRPLVFPMTSGDPVQVLSAIPTDITIDGNGALFTNCSGDQVFEFARGERVIVRGLRYVQGSGTLAGDAFGFDQNMRQSVLEDWSVDGGGVASGAYMQSTEGSVLRRGKVVNCAAGQDAISVMDAWSSGIEDCWIYGGSPTCAIFMGSLATAGYGNIDCWIRGGGIVGSTGGLYITCGQGTRVTDFSVKAVIGTGISIGPGPAGPPAGTTRTYLENVTAQFCAVSGLQVLSGAIDTYAKNLDVSHAGGGAGHTAYAALDLYADFTVDGLTIDLASNEASTAIRSQAGVTRIKNLRLTSLVAAGIGVFADGTRMEIDGAAVTIAGGGAVNFNVGAGVLSLSNIQASRTGGALTFTVASGATLILGHGCDLNNLNDTFTIAAGGSVVVAQAGEYPLTMAGGTQTIYWTQASSLVLSGTTGTINVPPVPGMQWTVINGGSGNAVVQPIGGTSITVATGKTAILRVNDAGNMARVTADT